MVTVFIRCYKNKPNESWQKYLDFKNINAAKEYCEELSKYNDVVNVELSLFEKPYKSYRDYIKERFIKGKIHESI